MTALAEQTAALPSDRLVVAAPESRTTRALHLVRGRPDDPVWVRPALLVLLIATALLYTWRLSASGWANSFYSAAVQAGSTSWKAFFFGSSDASNFITVDKSSAFLWPMDLLARVIGVNSWSILVPQALEGVASVAVLYLAVRRWFGPAAGLIAGAVLALTPVAALMFRFNNPDAMLTLLMTLGAYAVIRAVEHGSTRWIMLAGSLIGWAFLAKMLQGLLVLPAFGITYLVAAPVGFWRRIRQLVLCAVAMVVSAGWWVVIVQLWPATSRPYIGGSQHNSVVELIFGYNGFGRLTGNESGSVVGGGATQGGSQWGPTGLGRLFNTSFGGQISWLLPAALILCVMLVVIAGRAPRTDRTRAAALLWGGWLVVTGLAISLGKGIIHTYYTVALAPAIGALIGSGVVALWRRRQHLLARFALAATMGVTVWWTNVLLDRTPTWLPSLHVAVIVIGLIVAVEILVLPSAPKKLAGSFATLGLVAMLIGPASYTWQTVHSAHTGALPTAGPAGTSDGLGRFGAFGRFGGRAGRGAFTGAPPTNGAVPGGFGAGSPGTPPRNGAGRIAAQGGFGGGFPGGAAGAGNAGHTRRGLRGRGFNGGHAGGGILGGSRPSAALTVTLAKNADSYRWMAATVSANQASGYQLAADKPVMAIGGFNGTDPAPTLAQFKKLVASHKIHWFIGGDGGFGGFGGFGHANGGSPASTQISSWVTANFKASTVGGTTIYNLNP